MRDLSPAETTRYSRHISLAEIGVEGQLKLKSANVLVVGAGGLGSPAIQYLAAAGIGNVGVADYDRIEPTNLQRQTLYRTEDVGRRKVDVVESMINACNPEVSVTKHPVQITDRNAAEIIDGYHIVIDGTDNFAARYAVSDACTKLNLPYIYGSIHQFDGQVSVFLSPTGPCYRCLHPFAPPDSIIPSCAEGGVLGVLPGIIGTIQATEAIKMILGIGDPLIGRLLSYDALSMRFDEFRIPRRHDCPTCGVGTLEQPVPEITVDELCALIKGDTAVTILDVREHHERVESHIEGSFHIPLGDLETRMTDLDNTSKIVVHCQGGVRSREACVLLRSAGLSQAVSLTGGLKAWLEKS